MALGLWYYTRRFAPVEESIEPGTSPDRLRIHPGVYLLAEKRILDRQEGEGRLDVFMRVGIADARAHRFALFTGAGSVYAGLFPGRAADHTGLAVAVAWNGRRYRDAAARLGGIATRAETVVELTHRAVISERWSVQPDVQWIFDPGTEALTADAVLLGIRTEVGLDF